MLDRKKRYITALYGRDGGFEVGLGLENKILRFSIFDLGLEDKSLDKTRFNGRIPKASLS